MNMSSLFNFVEAVMNLLSNWLSCDKKELDWCPVRVDNRFDRY